MYIDIHSKPFYMTQDAIIFNLHEFNKASYGYNIVTQVKDLINKEFEEEWEEVRYEQN